MIGWEVSIRSTDGILCWCRCGLTSLFDYLDECVRDGDGELDSHGGYPTKYSIRASRLLPYLSPEGLSGLVSNLHAVFAPSSISI